MANRYYTLNENRLPKSSSKSGLPSFQFYKLIAAKMFCLIVNIGAGQAATTNSTDYFKSRQSGDWATAATWDSSPDNINWTAATEPPTKDARGITILSTDTVTISNSVSFDQTVVEGLLELQTGGILNINDGAGDDLTISSNGIFRITSVNNYAASVIPSGSAVINVKAGGKITIGDGSSSVGAGYENFAISSVNVWDNGSIYEYNSNNAFVANGLIYFPNSGSNIPIFRVTKVNGTPGGASDLVINGILEVNTSFAFGGNSFKIFRNGIRGNATLTQNSSSKNFIITASDAILDGGSLQIVLNNPLNLSSSTNIPAGANVTIAGGNINNSSSSNILTVNGSLDMTNQRITNTNGTVIINGMYRTSISGGFSSGGFTNSSIPSGNITVNPGSVIELYALTDQGLNQRSDFANLIFSGGGVKTPGNSFSPGGTVTIKDDAILDCSNHNIGGALTHLTMTDNSRLIVGTTGTQPAMEGSYTLTGGIIEFTNTNPTPQSIRTISSNYNHIIVSGNSVRNSSGNIKLNPGGSFTITPTGTFTINDDAITGATGVQTLTVQSGGVFNCGNSLGFYGALSGMLSPSVFNDIEVISLEPGSTINYTRSDPPLVNGDQIITTIGIDGSIPYQNLTLSGNGNKTAPVGILTIKGNFTKTNACVLVHNKGTILLNGDAEQTYSSSAPRMVFHNLTNHNIIGLHINDSLSVYKELLFGSNSKINLNADITLLSDNDNTANVAPLPSNTTITYNDGRFIAERHIPSHPKAWQFLGIPTKGSTIWESWMEGNAPDGNTRPGYGTLITGNHITWATDGFDLYSPGGPSMKQYDPVSNSWKGVLSTFDLIDTQNGYLLFVRGDRGTHFGDPATATIMRTRGKLYSPGTHAPASVMVPPDNFQSISNPYASAVDFNAILPLSPGISNAYYVWDPNLTAPSEYGLGSYRTISGNFSVPSSGSYTDGNIPHIQSGQAFFVSNPNASPVSVNFDESIKVSGSKNVFRGQGIQEPSALLRVNLFTIYESQPVLIDGALTLFHESYSNKVDVNDVLKLNNNTENLGISINDKVFTIERRSPVKDSDTLYYHLGEMKQKDYQLEIIENHLDQYGMVAFLKDNYLNTLTDIKTKNATIAAFSITNDSASYAKNRFSIILKPEGNLLPLSFVSIKGIMSSDGPILEWKVENESNLLHYLPERSADGLHFQSIGIVAALNQSKVSYSHTDWLPLEGSHYYRIKSVGKDGAINYSNVIKVFHKNIKPFINIDPNSVTSSSISIHFYNQPTGKYKINLFNTSGQLIVSKVILRENKTGYQLLPFSNNLPSGVYHLEIIKPDGMKTILKFSK